MLHPESRLSLLDALRPPPGFKVGIAVGTTYSLHLDAALFAPAAFALHHAQSIATNAGGEHADGDDTTTPLALLDSIRRHADIYSVFFQAGQASVPTQRRLHAFLEEGIIPVSAPRGGVFHPKVWAVRFDPIDGDDPSRFRVLCSSRNLTFDRSWDTILKLDSVWPDVASREIDRRQSRKGGTASSPGLGDFITALPNLAVAEVSSTRRTTIHDFGHQLRRVQWELPEGVTDFDFMPLGMNETPDHSGLPLPSSVDSIAVVSPFLSAGLLDQTPRSAGRKVLISRVDQLDSCASAVRRNFDADEIYTLHPDATAVNDESEGTVDGRSLDDPGIPFNDLHAKLFVADHGDQATVLTGSANATSAAFERNVEFVVKLTGPREQLGVDALLGTDDDDNLTLSSFLTKVTLADDDATVDELDESKQLDAARRTIANIPLTATAKVDDDRSELGSDVFALRFTSDHPFATLPEGMTWRCWPITLGQRHSQNIAIDGSDSELDVVFHVSLEAISSFLACELTLGECSTRFTLTAALVEQPESRHARLLRSLLGDANGFLRYLMLLLHDDIGSVDDPVDLLALEDALTNDPSQPGRNDGIDAPLLETLLRTLSRDPQRLVQLQSLLEELQSDPEAATIIPEDLDEVWGPIWHAATALGQITPEPTSQRSSQSTPPRQLP